MDKIEIKKLNCYCQCDSCTAKSWNEENKNMKFIEISVNHRGIILCEKCATKLNNILNNEVDCK